MAQLEALDEYPGKNDNDMSNLGFVLGKGINIPPVQNQQNIPPAPRQPARTQHGKSPARPRPPLPPPPALPSLLPPLQDRLVLYTTS